MIDDAIVWAKSQYRLNWKRAFTETLLHYQERRPVWVTADDWDRLFDEPFSNPQWNEYVKLMRQYVKENR